MRVPVGYTGLALGTRRVVVRDDLVPALGPWLLAGPLGPLPGAIAVEGGRGGAYRMGIGDGRRVVIRFGRRGGAIGLLVREWYWGWRPRPWRELSVSLAARARGAPVADVLAAAVHGVGVYRSAVVTAEIPAAATIIAALRAAHGSDERRALARVAATAVARLHDAGLMHADLNLTNILVADGDVAIVDLDRARLRAGSLGVGDRGRSMRRLRRSARKLDPDGAVIDDEVVRAFHEAYGREPDAACAS